MSWVGSRQQHELYRIGGLPEVRLDDLNFCLPSSTGCECTRQTAANLIKCRGPGASPLQIQVPRYSRHRESSGS